MESPSIVIDNVSRKAIAAILDALHAAANPDPEDGYRTRPGLSPRQAADELMMRPPIQRAVLAGDASAAVLAVRYGPESRAKEPWDGVVCCGSHDDRLYRQAYYTLFENEQREPPAELMQVSQPATRGSMDPRPTEDGWSVSLWFTVDAQQTASATRIVVPRYEDHLIPDLANPRSTHRVLRLANPGE